jgi:hypothetical protein
VTRHLRRAVVSAVLAATAALAPVRAARPAEAQTYITVVDTERHPVVGLSAEDFAMRDGAVREPVVDVEPATAPLSVAVVVHGFDPGDRDDVTTTIAAALRTLKSADPGHQIGLVETMPPGGPSLVALTPDRSRTDAAVARLLGSLAAGSRRGFVDSLLDACQGLKSAPADRRVVLAIARRRPGDGAVTEPTRLTDAILLGKIALWTIEVGPAQTTPLDRLLGDSADLGGALRENVAATSALPEASANVASLLVSQYLLTFTWPDPLLSQVSITIRHDRGVVLAPIWRR